MTADDHPRDSEQELVELKREHDHSNAAQRLQLVCEVVAIANSKGGRILLGVDESDGSRPGLDRDAVKKLDAAKISDLVDSFIGEDHVEVSCDVEASDESDRWVVALQITSHGLPPLVFSKQGQFQDVEGRQHSVFARHSVYVRKSTKAEPASRVDYRNWIEQAVQHERRRWQERVAMVAAAPPNAILQVVPPSAGGPIDEPAVLLDRAVATWRADSAKLLGKLELLTLFLVCDRLALGDAEYELLVQSALRRRPTLWFWLDLWMPSEERLLALLQGAVVGTDRDKSDAGNAIVEVAALFLSAPHYKKICSSLGESRYKHFREAAESGGTRAEVLERLSAVRSSLVEDHPLFETAEPALSAAAVSIAEGLLSDYSAARARQLNAVGLEVLARRLGKPKVP